ncbi:uncharacterized protein LOC124366551 isoform X2 [Homalodisca vitripennis]|uniref:uncharacterized protein LOC124366551 isoform X2 n=1 Tax=Homalodisca vitripennis TaxID=197043 RepID=UPI001EE9C396|nr:uncharacterized protein LOC124366551 isoform X2 [Homalodisca vitripennis]KAG8256833.1 hypothetical protein J6590_061779 [Homalodisca vitripennis]
MTRITLGEVVSIIERLAGRRGARIGDIVNYIEDNIHHSVIHRRLDSAVKEGILEKRGDRFKLAKCLTSVRKTRKSPRLAVRCLKTYIPQRHRNTNRKHPKKSKRVAQPPGYNGEQSVSRITSQRTFPSTSTFQSLIFGQPTKRCSEENVTDDMSSCYQDSRSKASNSSRLASARDSVEMLRERRLSKSKEADHNSSESTIHSLFCKTRAMLPFAFW